MFPLFYISFLFLGKVDSRLLPPPDEFTPRISLTKCVGKMTTLYHEGEVILLVVPVFDTGLLNRILLYELYSHHSVVIRKIGSIVNITYRRRIDNYLIIVRKLSDIEIVLTELNSTKNWNPNAKFLVTSMEMFVNPQNIASAIVNQLWSNRIFNGVVLLTNMENSTLFDAYSWWPFSNGNCGNTFEVKKVGECTFGKITGRNWFLQKIPNSLNGCPLKIQVVVWPPYVLPPQDNQFVNGKEIQLVNAISKIANFTPIYKTSLKLHGWGNIFPNGTATGAISLLMEKKVDFAIGAFAATHQRHQVLDSINYNLDTLMWCVPHAQDISQFKKILGVMEAKTWIAFISTYLLISLITWYLAHIEPKEVNLYRNLLNSFQNTLGVMLAMAVRIQPKTFPLRLIFATWVFSSLYTNFLYQTLIISQLTKPKYEQHVKTSDDVFDNHLKTWFLPNLDAYFSNQEDELSVKILRNWQICNDPYLCLEKVAIDKDSAVCLPKHFARYAIRRYVIKKQPLFYCFKDSIVTYPVNIYFQRNHYLFKRLYSLIRRVGSSGLDSYWEKDVFNKQSLQYKINMQLESKKQHQITFDKLIQLFIALFCSYVFAIIVFVLEVMFKKFKG